jgi:creatinine amidohydrolase
MVIEGVLGRLEKAGKELIIAPTVWYGVSSYAVAGPEKGTVHVDVDTFEAYITAIVKSLLEGGHRNIYLLVHHQTEEDALMPMTLACLKAGKKVIFDLLEKERGIGWWGNNEMRNYYSELDGKSNPFNFIKTIPLMSGKVQRLVGGIDHAGKCETSLLAALYPLAVDFNRIALNTEWFTETAREASVELGEKIVDAIVQDLKEVIT